VFGVKPVTNNNENYNAICGLTVFIIFIITFFFILVLLIFVCLDELSMKNGLKVHKVTSNQKIGIPTNQRKRNMKNCPITVMFSSKTDSTNTWTSEIKHYSL
jgi:hypothetical protein